MGAQQAPTATVAKPTDGHPDGLRSTGLAAIWAAARTPGPYRIWRARGVSADGERIDGADKPADELRLRHRSPADHPLCWWAIALSSDADADQ